MIDGREFEFDQTWLIRREEFVCGDCRHSMIPIGADRYQCPHCGVVFEDMIADEPNNS